MKPIHLILSGIAIVCASFTQNPVSAQSAASQNIDINNIDALLHATGDHFWDLVSTPKYEVPRGSGKNTIFASSLWLGGYDSINLHIAAMTYRQTGTDFWPGPLDTATGTSTISNSSNWDYMWKVSRAEIEAFIKDHTKATNDIKTWPAHGNTSLGEAKNLAPFVDTDHDGMYDYTKGDYPKIKGDQAVWWVFNDNTDLHTETQGEAFGLEIHAMAYAFASNADTLLNNTLFFEYDIINRSKNDYKNVYLGLWTDFDLGYGFDDYIGSDSALSAYFAYNGDPEDEGLFGYGKNIPVQSVVFLNDSLKNFIVYQNDFTKNGNPEEAIHYYNYLKATWLDGKPLLAGCNGYVCPGAKTTHYMYSGNPLDSTLWHEKTAGNKPGDRRGLGSTGPINLKPGNKHTFNFAYVTTFKQSGSTETNLAAMYNDIKNAKKYYRENLNTGIYEAKIPFKYNFTFKAFPNPANGFVKLQWNNTLVENVRIVNVLGQTVLNQPVSNGKREIIVDTKHFPRGVYMAVAENRFGKSIQRIVLQ